MLISNTDKEIICSAINILLGDRSVTQANFIKNQIVDFHNV